MHDALPAADCNEGPEGQRENLEHKDLSHGFCLHQFNTMTSLSLI